MYAGNEFVRNGPASDADHRGIAHRRLAKSSARASVGRTAECADPPVSRRSRPHDDLPPATGHHDQLVDHLVGAGYDLLAWQPGHSARGLLVSNADQRVLSV